MKLSSKFASVSAAAALALSPVAAQAGTRAGSEPVSVEASSLANDERGAAAAGFRLEWLLLLLALIGALVVAAGGGGRSRG